MRRLALAGIVAVVGVAAAAPSAPSGSPMPSASPPGWHRVLASDFGGHTLGPCWYRYQGVPGSSPTALWEPSHVVISGGEAHLLVYRDARYGGRWVSGGMSSAPCLKQRYGRYLVRFRMTRASGVKYAILLWPAHVPWPCGGEIDFGEDGGGNRRVTALTVHYCDRHGQDATPRQAFAHAALS